MMTSLGSPRKEFADKAFHFHGEGVRCSLELSLQRKPMERAKLGEGDSGSNVRQDWCAEEI